MENDNMNKHPWENDGGENENKKPWETEDIPVEYKAPQQTHYTRPVREDDTEAVPEEPEVPEESAESESDKPEKDEKQTAPDDYSYQRYTPPKQYQNTYYDNGVPPRKPKKSANAAFLAVISVICVLVLAVTVFVMYLNDWKLPSEDIADEKTSTEGKDDGTSVTEKDKTDKKDEKGEKKDKDDTKKGDTDVEIDIKPADGDVLSYKQVYEKCSSGAVGIKVKGYTTVSTIFGSSQQEVSGVGSGFVVDGSGYIATNAHVVSGMETITVYMSDGEVLPATLIGCDIISDVAVIKVESENELTVLDFGDSTELSVGDIVCAIGTPNSIDLAGTFTQGIISAVDRKIAVRVTENSSETKTMTLLQTDATINPGNSGGPLLNMYGQVIGINTLKLTSDYEGIGFAIPSIHAKKIISQIIAAGGDISYDPENGYVEIEEKCYLGITVTEISRQQSAYYRVPQGLQVRFITDGCALQLAGVQVGDIVTEFCGVEVTTSDELISERDKYKPGDECTVKFYRNKEYYTVSFKMDSNLKFPN